MFGRSSARRGASQEEAVAADFDDYDPGDAPRSPRRGRPRAGSGGRWWVWVARAVLWAFIIVVMFNGVWWPLRGGLAQPSEKESTEDPGPQFPTTAASAFAVRFASVYLNGEETAGDGERDRAEVLAEFVPEGEASAFDNVGTGLTGENIEVATIDVEDDQNAVVTLSVDINDEPMSLDVPVYADDNAALVVSGEPALLAAPSTAELPSGESVENDTEVRDELRANLEGFFEAYAETPDHLTRYVEPGASVTELPEDTVAFQEIDNVVVPVGSGDGEDVREATATVVWRLSGAEADTDTAADVRQSYELTVVKDGGNWYVRDIRGAPQSFSD
ncbi:conjugal transfer protein [Halostreptopolyspora alba]|uniref:Conjugal transfer protein n=1 Tax=Halostreptopolyspora alba TaxID=2487137 RepID=A0A3N0E3V7_9ACTN|nr:conjugal transfer protein [Nocardiopsaceae bacterium YIM 96095]